MDNQEIYNFRAPQTDVKLFQKGMLKLPSAIRSMGFTELREGQDRGVYSILGGQDTICVFPTAMGKTATFVVPTLAHGWKNLIFSPLKALMRDQVRGLQDKGISALCLSSDNKEIENNRNIADWVKGNCDILYVAPERLRNEAFLKALKQAPPDMITIDEAHVLSGWSDNFRHAYMFIGDIVEQYNPRVVAAFTATLSQSVEADVRRVLRMPDAVKIFHFPERSNLKLSSSNIDMCDDMEDRVRGVNGSVLIYCGSRKLTEETAARLSKSLREEVGFYHSEVREDVKKGYQDAFFAGRIRVMCATNAFGMGIDKGDIRSVIHLRYPGDPEALAQETGRAGRDGKDSWCHTYESTAARRMHELFINSGHPPEDFYRRVFGYMESVSDSSGCFQISGAMIEDNARVGSTYHLAILEALHGHGVIEPVDGAPKVHKVKFIKSNDAIGRYVHMQELIPAISTPDGSWWQFDLDVLSDRMGVGAPTVRKYIKTWQAENLLLYEPPPPGTPKRIVGSLDLIDFERLNAKRELAYKKLDYVQGYFSVPDSGKHAYLTEYFTRGEP